MSPPALMSHSVLQLHQAEHREELQVELARVGSGEKRLVQTEKKATLH